MECNKEEAVRAKGIAESKMQSKDFSGARKIALKAQQLYKDLENISQMLCVCDVHCSAENRLFGNEMDWYGILQIEKTADEATIKKQYRKFALQLHPDKNKFPGAEAAFKLVGEAQRLLLDKEKRSLYDLKCEARVRKPAPHYRPQQSTTSSSNFGFQNNIRSNFAGVNFQFQQHQQSAAQQGHSNGRPTFWTACPFCSVKYQYYIEIKNKQIICQTCNKNFSAWERSMQVNSTVPNMNQPPFPQRKDVPNRYTCKVELRHQGNFNVDQSRTEFSQKKAPGPGSCAEKVNGNAEKVNGKRPRKEEESSESCDSESSVGSEEDTVVVDDDDDFKARVKSGVKGDVPRRSDRRKQQVSYKENLSDDEDFVTAPKKAKARQSASANEDGRSSFKEDTGEPKKRASDEPDQNGMTQRCNPGSLPNKMEEPKTTEESVEGNGCQNSSETCVDSAVDPECYESPDPEFNDFDKIRTADCFSVGQIWALFDTMDAMPRFYGRIEKISPGFRLKLTWLEAAPDEKNEIEWVKADLPTSCGKFEYGNSETIKDRLMFCYRVPVVKVGRKDTVKIFPKKGDTWALFKNWDIKWKFDENRNYEYEFVEILSDYAEGFGARVAFLGKLKGFVSLFCRISREDKDSLQIPPGELFRFSHRVPSFKLTGEEREGVPKGSFELDPLALPKNIEEIDVPEEVLPNVTNAHNPASSTSPDKVKPEMVSGASSAMHQDSDANISKNCSASAASSLEAVEIPDPEFFNFEAAKTNEKFKVGQVWSLYCDEDGLPKYYGLITGIQYNKGFKLNLRWLTPCPSSEVVWWFDKKMPICCGRFKVGGRPQNYGNAISFSHQVTAEPIIKDKEYVILPRKGEVWALYRNWSVDMKVSDLEFCKYDIVEVLEESNRQQIKVSVLEHVKGFHAVFKPEVKEGTPVTMAVLCSDVIRFSHQIPAFRLTEERDGSLRGYWELDPAAMPMYFFS